MKPRCMVIDTAELGPRNAKVGDRMTGSNPSSGYATLYEFDGSRWIRIATYDPRLYPKCWTLSDGTVQADHP